MQCTPEQIQAKRKLALQKLAEKRTKLSSPAKSSNQSVPPTNGSVASYFGANVSNGSPKHFAAKANVANSSPNHFAAKGKPYKPTVAFGGKVVTASLSLISRERFVVVLSAFSTPAVEVLKTIPSRSFDPKTKNWSCHVGDYELLVNKLSQLKPDVEVERMPLFALNCVRKKGDDNGYDLRGVDPELLNTLMPFQEEGVCFGISKNGRCLIADDMGLGKTFQALAIANYYKSDWPLLIVTTASMKNVWESTIHKYLPSVPVMRVQYLTSGRDHFAADILIVSYDLMSRCTDKLADYGFGALIMDESHTLKNSKTKCTQAAIRLSKIAKRVVLLSGTPALSRPSELYSQLALLDDRFFGGFMVYSKRYCDGKQSNFGWDASGQSNLQELEVILSTKFMIRRTKEDVLHSLPNKTQEVISLDVKLQEFSDEDRMCLLSLANKYNTVQKDKHATLLLFFAETAKIKIPAVCSYVLQTLETDRKFLVFAHHQKMLDSIERCVKKAKVKYIRIDGNTTTEQRKFFVDRFQGDPEYRCAVLSIVAANAGITLTAANLVLFAELHWNPSILSQAEARAHRIGQTEHVTIRYLLAPGTSDDSVWPLLQEKQKTLQNIGLSADSYDGVTVRKHESAQETGKVKSILDLTQANTLDISSYFTPPPPKKPISSATPSFDEDMLDDDMDDLFNSVELE